MIRIARADLDAADFIELIAAHKRLMLEHSPPESSHALPIDGLKADTITVWDMREQGVLLGCGALKEIGPRHGEIKAMHTIAARRGEGLGARMLEYILGVARDRGYHRVSLETGSMTGFAPARRLYAAYGFSCCGPFAAYNDDPNSIFMTCRLIPASE